MVHQCIELLHSLQAARGDGAAAFKSEFAELVVSAQGKQATLINQLGRTAYQKCFQAVTDFAGYHNSIFD
eukprot:9574485-Prorocentrum_lima.AAC.1